jgi:hypothetical protein
MQDMQGKPARSDMTPEDMQQGMCASSRHNLDGAARQQRQQGRHARRREWVATVAVRCRIAEGDSAGDKGVCSINIWVGGYLG